VTGPAAGVRCVDLDDAGGLAHRDLGQRGVPAMTKSGDSAAATMANHDPRAVGVRGLIQRLGPNIHNWNASTIFSTDRLFDDVGFRPPYSFAAAVEETYEWFQREKYSEQPLSSRPVTWCLGDDRRVVAMVRGCVRR